MTTPTRRTMRQQTLAHSLGMTPPPPSTPAASSPAPVTSDAKRSTRAQTTPTKPPATAATSTTTTADATPARTPSPTRQVRARKARSPALPVVRTPQLRPRRTPSSYAGLRAPYERYALEALREECARRGLSARPREQEAGVAKPVTRNKSQLVELLQEADMLAMFERQSQKKTGRRAARTVRLTPPPAPIRVAAAPTATAEAASTNASATVTVLAPPAPPASAPLRETAAPAMSPATPLVTTAPSATDKAVAPKKPTRPPPARKSVQPMVAAMTPTVTIPAPPPAVSTPAIPSNPQPPAAPWLAPVPVPQLPTTQISAIHEKEQEMAAPPVAPKQAVVPPTTAPPTTVDLTEDELTVVPQVQPAMPRTKPIQVVQKNVRPAKTPRVAQANPVAPRAVASPTAAAAGHGSTAPAIRARRGCRFRLINVVLSPDFNTRWSEMNVPVKSRGDVNAFWRDVHISFLCQNSFYGKVHFDDALFESVTPDVIQNHTAQKLQQMWTEIVSTYRRTHVASLKTVEPKPFLDSCAGRLDVLYLHMALLLEPELHQLVLNETPRLKIAPKNTTDATARVPAAKPANPSAPKPRSLPGGAEEPQLAMANASVNPERGPRFVELQNPEMLPDWLLEDQAKTAAERGELVDFELPQAHGQPIAQHATASQVGAKAKKSPGSKSKTAAIAQTLSPEIAHAAEHASPVQTRDMVLHSSAINSIDDSASSDYETSGPNIPVAQPTRRRAPGKRRREASPSELPSSELVELASSRELVAHPHKRMHTAVTTTMTRSQEMVLPPDEFDVQTNRLRKINESIDQCYRTLGNKDAILNDMHRADVESDLRFYLGIKKRIQEQIVMFMHGF